MEGTFITFEEIAPNPKTKRWAAVNKQTRGTVGTVVWYGPWRKYCFCPADNTVFEQVCMREIAQFIEDQTQAHRKSKTNDN